MTLIADVFPDMLSPKNVVRSMFKKLRFTGPFNREHGKWDATLLQFERQQLYIIY